MEAMFSLRDAMTAQFICGKFPVVIVKRLVGAQRNVNVQLFFQTVFALKFSEPLTTSLVINVKKQQQNVLYDFQVNGS